MNGIDRSLMLKCLGSISVVGLAVCLIELPNGKSPSNGGVIRGHTIELSSPSGDSVIYMSAANDTATVTIRRGRNSGFISLQASYQGDQIMIGGVGGESLVIERIVRDGSGKSVTPTTSIKVHNEIGLPIKSVRLQ